MAIAFDTEATGGSGNTTDLQVVIDPGALSDCLLLTAYWHSGAQSITANTVTGSDAVSLTPQMIWQSPDTALGYYMQVWAIFDTGLGAYGNLTWATQTAAAEAVNKRIVSFSGVHQDNPIITVGGWASSSEFNPPVMEMQAVTNGVSFSSILCGNVGGNPAVSGTWTELTELSTVGDDSAAYLLSAADATTDIDWNITATAGDDNSLVMVCSLRPATASVGVFDSEQYYTKIGMQQVLTLTHRGGAGANCVAIQIGMGTSTDAAPTITYSGSSPTLQQDIGTTTQVHIWGYTLTGPADIQGSQDLAITMISATWPLIRVVVLRNINQSAPLVNSSGNHDTATPGTAAVTSIVGNYTLCFAIVGHSAKNLDETGTPTENTEIAGEFFDMSWASEAALTTTTTFTWGWVSEACTMVAMAFQYAPGAGQVIWHH